MIGIGSLGAAGILLAGLRAPRVIVGYGVRSAELELAKRLGTHATIDVASGDPVAATEALVPGWLDVVIEAAGATAATELATRLVRRGGRVVLLGLAGAGREVTLPADRFTTKDLTVHGVLSYDRSAWSTTVGLVRDGSSTSRPYSADGLPSTTSNRPTQPSGRAVASASCCSCMKAVVRRSARGSLVGTRAV